MGTFCLIFFKYNIFLTYCLSSQELNQHYMCILYQLSYQGNLSSSRPYYQLYFTYRQYVCMCVIYVTYTIDKYSVSLFLLPRKDPWTLSQRFQLFLNLFFLGRIIFVNLSSSSLSLYHSTIQFIQRIFSPQILYATSNT